MVRCIKHNKITCFEFKTKRHHNPPMSYGVCIFSDMTFSMAVRSSAIWFVWGGSVWSQRYGVYTWNSTLQLCLPYRWMLLYDQTSSCFTFFILHRTLLKSLLLLCFPYMNFNYIEHCQLPSGTLLSGEDETAEQMSPMSHCKTSQIDSNTATETGSFLFSLVIVPADSPVSFFNSLFLISRLISSIHNFL